MKGLTLELNSAFWAQIKEKMRGRNSSNSYLETMLENIEYVSTSVENDIPKLVLGVPNDFFHFMVSENLLKEIVMEISGFYKNKFNIDLKVTGKALEEPLSHKTAQPTHLNEFNNIQQDFTKNYNQVAPQNGYSNQVIMNTQSVNSQESQLTGRLNLEYTFSTFVIGRNTEFAHAASYNVATNPGADGYNPLFICGPVGMGKTHLINAVGNQIRQSFQHLRINYISAERFLNECVSSIRAHKMDKFRQKYREGTDVLLVDDVQFLRGESVQEEFFHTINTLLERKCQVVVASDRMPKDIRGIEDRIRSRLEWGLIADISMPDIETRIAILRYKAEKLGIRLNEDVVNFISRISKRSIRELEGNLKKVKMFSELQGLHVDLELAKRVLATHESQGTISVEDIQKIVCDHYKIKVLDLKGKARSKNILIPRQIAMYLVKKHLDKSLVDIGNAFGGRDHTTVINSLEKVGFLQEKDKDIKNDIEELTNSIHNITGL
jgi:chromosomal replication initiator protein